MLYVKVLRHGQVTLPKRFREALGIKEGDILAVDLNQEGVVLKPRLVLDKQKAWRELTRLLKDVQRENERFSDEEVIRDVLEAISEVRAEKHAKGRR